LTWSCCRAGPRHHLRSPGAVGVDAVVAGKCAGRIDYARER